MAVTHRIVNVARDRYKQLLIDAILAAGGRPMLGGIEYAEDIVGYMDINRAARADESFRHFVEDLRHSFRR